MGLVLEHSAVIGSKLGGKKFFGLIFRAFSFLGLAA
jgi:hypothetical protein